MEIYAVRQPDGDDRGSGPSIVGYFTSYEDALKVFLSGYRNGSMGPPTSPEVFIQKVVVFENLVQFAASCDVRPEVSG